MNNITTKSSTTQAAVSALFFQFDSGTQRAAVNPVDNIISSNGTDL